MSVFIRRRISGHNFLQKIVYAVPSACMWNDCYQLQQQQQQQQLHCVVAIGSLSVHVLSNFINTISFHAFPLHHTIKCWYIHIYYVTVAGASNYRRCFRPLCDTKTAFASFIKVLTIFNAFLVIFIELCRFIMSVNSKFGITETKWWRKIYAQMNLHTHTHTAHNLIFSISDDKKALWTGSNKSYISFFVP